MYSAYVKTDKSRFFLNSANVFIIDNECISVISGKTIVRFSYSKESNSYVEVGKPDILEELCINGEVIYKYEVR